MCDSDSVGYLSRGGGDTADQVPWPAPMTRMLVRLGADACADSKIRFY